MFESVPLPRDQDLSEPALILLAELPPLHIFRLLSIMPGIFPAYVGFAKAMYEGISDRKIRQIALLRAACKIDAKYLIHQYTLICKSLGVEDGEIKAILKENPVRRFNEKTNFLCKVADEITLNSKLCDETFHEFYSHFSIEEGTELLFFLSAVSMMGRFTNAARLPIEEISPLEGKQSFFPE